MTFTKEQLIAAAHGRIDFANMMLSDNPEPLKERTWSIELELARIALSALRERAEPVYQVQAMDWHDVEKYLYDEALDRGIRCRVLYTAPPAPVVPKIDRKAICNKAHWLCARSPGATFYNAAEFALDEVMELLAPPAPVVADAATAIRACLEEFPESVHDIVEECAAIAENACRAAMIK